MVVVHNSATGMDIVPAANIKTVFCVCLRLDVKRFLVRLVVLNILAMRLASCKDQLDLNVQ